MAISLDDRTMRTDVWPKFKKHMHGRAVEREQTGKHVPPKCENEWRIAVPDRDLVECCRAAAI